MTIISVFWTQKQHFWQYSYREISDLPPRMRMCRVPPREQDKRQPRYSIVYLFTLTYVCLFSTWSQCCQTECHKTSFEGSLTILEANKSSRPFNACEDEMFHFYVEIQRIFEFVQLRLKCYHHSFQSSQKLSSFVPNLFGEN